MDLDLQLKCLEVLEKIKDRPTAKWFMEPVDPKTDHCPDYYQRITKPSDLGTVQTRLENNEYKSVAAFKEDIALIWSNCMKYWGEESYISILALDLKQFSERLLNFISDQPQIDWINELLYWIEELSSATKPLNYSSISSKKRSTSNPSIKQFDIIQDEPVEEITVSNNEILALKEDIESFTTDEEKTELAECMKTLRPRLFEKKPIVNVNLSILPPGILKTLMDKVSEMKNRSNKGSEDSNSEEDLTDSSSD